MSAARGAGAWPGGGTAADSPATDLIEPIVEQFRVGTLTLGWDGEVQRVVIEARELGEDEEDEDEEEVAEEEAAGLSSLAARVHRLTGR